MKCVLLLASLLLAAAACRSADDGATAAEPPAEPALPAQQQQQASPAAQQPAAAPAARPELLDPAGLDETAPGTFKAIFETTKGAFVIEVNRDWAPQGADRFYNLVQNGFFEDIAFFRAVDGFMVQFGIHGNPRVAETWRNATFPDDAPKQSNQRGMVSFATSGPDSRTTQIFINYKDNAFLDNMGFAPFGRIVQGMDVVDSLHKGYGEGAPRGRGPNQGRIQTEGNTYLRADFPELDYVKSATVEK